MQGNAEDVEATEIKNPDFFEPGKRFADMMSDYSAKSKIRSHLRKSNLSSPGIEHRAGPGNLDNTRSGLETLPADDAPAHSPFFAISFITSISRAHSATILLQPCVLLLKLAKPANVRHIELPMALTPRVDGLLTHTVALGDPRHRLGIRLAQDPHHPLFAESALLHGSLSSPSGEPSSQQTTGPKISGPASSLEKCFRMRRACSL